MFCKFITLPCTSSFAKKTFDEIQLGLQTNLLENVTGISITKIRNDMDIDEETYSFILYGCGEFVMFVELPLITQVRVLLLYDIIVTYQ